MRFSPGPITTFRRKGAFRVFLRILYNVHPAGLSKPDVLKSIGFKPPPITTFRPPSKFYGPWSAMKTLILHGLVDRVIGRSPKFVLTEPGLRLASDQFGRRPPAHEPDSSLSFIIASSEIQCRISIDVADVMRRCQMKWRVDTFTQLHCWEF
jgi:hypothetical protein